MTHMELAEKLQQLRPRASWVLQGSIATLERLQWLDELQTKPTQEELDAA